MADRGWIVVEGASELVRCGLGGDVGDHADSVVVLLGDVVLTDAGWAMRRATVISADDGAKVASSELAPIAALIVVDDAVASDE